MNRVLIVVGLIVSVLSSCSTKQQKAISIQYQNPIDVQFGDPYILSAANDTFYMYGTGHVSDGFVCYSSPDLVNWTLRKQVYKATSSSWGVKNFWAPEVYERNGKYYMFYSADWKENPNNDVENFKIGVAVADQPTGPFVDLTNKPIFDPGYPIIDANVYTDEDGTNYLYYSRCCYKHPVLSEFSEWAHKNKGYNQIEESWIYGVKLSSDFTHTIGDPVMLVRPEGEVNMPKTEWENRSVNNMEINRRWTEGSTVFKEKGKYYMTYSVNFYKGPYYAVGYATADSPMGPFIKADNNPILQENATKGGIVTGTGHNSFVYDKNGEPTHIVYHGRTKNTGDERVVFIDKVKVDSNGRLIVDGPTSSIQNLY